MRKNLLSLPLAVICCMALGQAPASAADTPAVTSPVDVGVRTLGFLSGMVVGIPISAVREVPDSIGRNVKGVANTFSKDNDPDETQIIAATIPGMALGLFDGLATGASKGVVNAYREEPFSLASFSLDEGQ